MDNPGGWVKFLWGEKVPLDPGTGAKALAYWIVVSESDPWTFDDLTRLVGVFLDRGERPPGRLDQWAHEKAAGRRTRPSRTGRKSDRSADIRIALAVALNKELLGMTQKSVNDLCRTKRSMDGFKGALRRGRSFIKGSKKRSN